MADYVKGIGALGKLAMSLGRELFGFQIRANPKIAELAERAGVTMDTIDAAPPEALSAILDRAARQGAIDPRDANNITIQIAKDAQEAVPAMPTLKVDNPGGDWLQSKLRRMLKLPVMMQSQIPIAQPWELAKVLQVISQRNCFLDLNNTCKRGWICWRRKVSARSNQDE